MERNEFRRAYSHYYPLPPEFAKAIFDEWDSPTIDGLLLAARIKGWSLRALGEAVGVTGEAARLHSIAADISYAYQRLDDVPELPKPAPVPPRPVPIFKQDIPEPEASELRRLNDIARTVNGAVDSSDPRRAASVELAHRFKTLIDQGYSPGRIGKAAGVTRAAVMMRIRRHGYAPLWPSQKVDNYIGRSWYETKVGGPS